MKTVEYGQLGIKKLETNSTQEDLKSFLKQETQLPHLFYISSEVQTHGKGRSGNVWSHEKGNLCVSVLLKELPFDQITFIPLWVSVCLLKAFNHLRLDTKSLRIKWPNDIWSHDGRKLGGIICEKVGPVMVIGIGLNIVKAPSLDRVTASLKDLQIETTSTDLLNQLLVEMKQVSNFDEMISVYERYSYLKKGDFISWINDQTNQKHEATVLGLGDFGELLVQQEDLITQLYSEDVVKVKLIK